MNRIGLFVPFLLVLFAGCHGIQVVDNTYQSLSGQNIHVADSFKYIGQADVFDNSRCPDCPMQTVGRAKVRSDVFVEAKGNQVQRFVIIERRMIGGKYYWLPLKGPQAQVGDRSYVKEFFSANGTDRRSGYYVSKFEDAGYDVSKMGGAECLVKSRNFSEHGQGALVYCEARSIVPEKLREGGYQEYMEKKFDATITAEE